MNGSTNLAAAASMVFVTLLAAPPVSADAHTDCRLSGACCFPAARRTEQLRSSPPHKAVVGPPTSTRGGLTQGHVRRTIARQAAALADCYPRRLPSSVGEGRVGLELVILPLGNATLLAAKGFDAEVTSCMATVIEEARFPRSRNGDITHTFVPITIVD